MRARLRQLGADPDRPTGWRKDTSSHVTPAEQSDELEKLRNPDKGTLSDEEYERVRDRLRRY
jgi:hypothetical protein